MEKKVLIKVYDKEGNFKKAWKDAEFVGFSKEINGGLGECKLRLARKFDDYGEYDDVALNNEIRIYISDNDEANKLIYAGYIAEYEPWIDGSQEGVSVMLLGYYTKLSQDIYKNGTTTTITETSEDVGVMFRNLIDRYAAENPNSKIYYTNESEEQTSTTATYTFEMMTYRECIEKIKELAPANWWWYVDEKHIIHFRDKPSTATHTFIFGRHFSKVRVKKSMSRIKNAVLFWNTETGAEGIYKLYTDAASINDYDRRLTRKIDQNRVGAETDADKISENYISENKDPHILVEADILDNNENDKGYDIESIDPGDTCSFAGFDESYDETFKENMLITRVEYRLDKVRITLEPLRAGVVNRQEDINKKIDSIDTSGAPTDYTT